MTFIETNYVNRNVPVTTEECRVYGETDCNDPYFSDLIYENREYLNEEFVGSNKLYVLMDNINIIDEPKYYASISFRTHRRGNDTIYQICLITQEGCVPCELLKEFFSKVFEDLSLGDRIRIAFTSNPLKTTYRIDEIGNRERCINNLMEELGITNEQNEQPN